MKFYLLVPILISLISFTQPAFSQSKVSPSEVYAQTLQIKKEVLLIMRHLKIHSKLKGQTFRANLQPRHVWQKTYYIQVKINVFKNKHNFSRTTIGTLEPVLNIEPILPYEQTQRILTELAIIKKRLGIRKKTSSPKTFRNKKPIDVFNKLHEVSLMMDELNKEAINSNYVFAETMRAHEDINIIITHLRIKDESHPPAKRADVQSQDSLEETIKLMHEIQRLQKEAGIKRVDFSPFYKKKNVTPPDVFNLIGMCITELKVLKAYLEISTLTHPAEFHTDKTAAEVHQLLGWSTMRLNQVSTLR